MGIFFDNWMATHREPPKLYTPHPTSHHMGIFFDNWMATHREPPKLYTPPPLVIPPLRVYPSAFKKGLVKQYASTYYKRTSKPYWIAPRRKWSKSKYAFILGKWCSKRWWSKRKA